jgi:alkanesulfonate monooxygenase SsuD/methylene tetrahydromethanopterin reductase-like flavin-dependent oxidoreductase (luciferase family)
MRNAVVLAKELATIDVLTRGRLIAGVGVGWSEAEYRNVGVGDIFHQRGAYLDEAIALWRHLWSGTEQPFHGRFFSLEDFVFGPLPVQGDRLPILVGGRTEAAYRRAGRLADGYHATMVSPAQLAERVPAIRAAADSAGRPMPELSTRANVRFPDSTIPKPAYAISGNPEEMAAEVRAFAASGAVELALAFGEADPGPVAACVARWQREVAPLV